MLLKLLHKYPFMDSSELEGIRVILCINGAFCQELVPHAFLFVVMHTILLISFHLWCMLGVSVLNLNKEQPISVH